MGVSDLDVMELVQQQLSGGPSLQESIGRLAQSDPQLAPIAQLLVQREEQLARELERDGQESMVEQQEMELREARQRRAAALREHLDEISAEVDALRARLGDLAAALGACPVCFGDDRGCSVCRGRGGAGFMPPDPAGFDRLVMPALRLHVRLHGRQITAVDDGATRERSAS
jgi:hypothetical protein